MVSSKSTISRLWLRVHSQKIALDSSLNELSINLLTVQIGCTESPLVSSLFVLSLYGESLGGHDFAIVLSTIVLQALLDSARGELELTQ